MANTLAITNSFKAEVMLGLHQLGAVTLSSRTSLTAPTTDTIKGALYLASATNDSNSTAYTATGEVSGAGYTAGGVAVTNGVAPVLNGAQGVWTPSASIVFNGVTLATAFDALMLYNFSQGSRAIGVFTFGSQTVTAGNFTLTMPTNVAGSALLRLA